jgi:hypothetical protein
MTWITPTGILLAVLLALAACSAKEPELTYKDDIAPIMAQHCVECHSAANMGAIVSGFDAGSYEKMMNGTKHGLIINPGSAESSPLYLLASGSAAPVIQMKHRDVSPGPEQIETIKLWIDQGAVYLP